MTCDYQNRFTSGKSIDRRPKTYEGHYVITNYDWSPENVFCQIDSFALLIFFRPSSHHLVPENRVPMATISSNDGVTSDQDAAATGNKVVVRSRCLLRTSNLIKIIAGKTASLLLSLTVSPKDNQLDTKTLATFDLSKLSLSNEDMSLMVKLQDKCQLLLRRPLSLIECKVARNGVKLDPDELIYQEHRTLEAEGYCSLLDKKGERYRKEKLLESIDRDPEEQEKLDILNKKKIQKFGQWPSQFKWKFPWTGARSKSSPTLKELIR